MCGGTWVQNPLRANFLSNIYSVYIYIYIYIAICLLRHGPPRLAFASCGHALSVNRSRKIKNIKSVRRVSENLNLEKEWPFLFWVLQELFRYIQR